MKSRLLRFEETILLENDDYIIINKPPFISTLEDRNDPVNILSLAKKYCSEAQVAHRLDKETSGVLAIAKNPEAYRHLSIQFEDRKVVKVYHAVSDGLHSFQNQTVDKRILPMRDGSVMLSPKGKSSQTVFNTLKTFSRHSLIECRPLTGRMHQIRIHLASIGAPITGDTLYGGVPFLVSSVKRGFRMKKNTEEEPLIKRFALHALSLEFSGLNGQLISIQAPYPKDFTALLKQLSAYSR